MTARVAMRTYKTIDELDASDRTVLIRVDFNVPVKDGVVTDDTRIREALPTFRRLLYQGARIVVLSHRGRPSGTGYEEEFSMRPAAELLAEKLQAEVILSSDVAGPDSLAKAAALQPGQILMVENLRFDKREKKNDPEFCEQLAALGDVFVNEAFGAAHRKHASMYGIAFLLPCYAGYLMDKEVTTLYNMLNNPRRPFVAILGGSKVSDKIEVIDSLLDICNTLVIGGGMCFTFLAAKGYSVGDSLMEEEWVERAAATMERAERLGVKFLLPVDVVAADRFAADADYRVVAADRIPDGMMGLDIGPETVKLYSEAIAEGQMVFWNGPAGVFEWDAFAKGTEGLARAVAGNSEATTIIGGGDSVAAINKFGLASEISFISTGGGASMQLLRGEELPAVVALSRA